jgi:hypothetical protein
MLIVVYFASEYNKSNSSCFDCIQPPTSVVSYLKKECNDLFYNLVNQCPAITNYYKNVYAIYPTYDYELKFYDEKLCSNSYDQEFYDNNVCVRKINLDSALFSYLDPSIVFFTEEKSLLIETLKPSLHQTYNDYFFLQGSYDIGKHLRRLETPIAIKKNQHFYISRNTPLYYVKFNTEEKIVFKRFVYTKDLFDLTSSIIKIRSHTRYIKPLMFWYDLTTHYSLKNKFINIIKQNLIE